MSDKTKSNWWNSENPEYFLEAGRPLRHLYGLNGEAPYFLSLQTEQDFLEAYRVCPPLKAIVGRRSKAFNNGVTDVFNKNTENPGRGREAANLRQMLIKPNVLQTGVQFFSQQSHYIDLFGYCPVLAIRIPGFADEWKAWWNIPPWLFDLTYTRKWLYQYKLTGVYEKFYIFWEGQRMELDLRDVHFIFDDGIGSDCDTNLTIPDSRLVGLDYVVSNIIASYKARNTLITKRGAIGILSNEAGDARGTPMTIDQEIKDSLQKDFKQYGIVGQPFQIILTDAKLKWQQMGFPSKELMLHEEVQDNIYRLCDAYGWPPELTSRTKDTTYENKNQARIDLYHDVIIPESRSRMQQFSSFVCTEEGNLEIKTDYSNVPVLQKEKKEKAEARKALDEAMEIERRNGLVTKNDWRVELGMDKITDDPSFEEYKEDVEEEPNDKENGNNSASKNTGASKKK